MKKLLVVLSLACAGASVFAAGEQYQDPWFKGLNNPTSIKALGESGGAWDGLTDDNAEVSSSKLLLDLDTTEEAVFTAVAPGDTNTFQSVSFTGVFTPIKDTELMTGEAMSTAAAQVGFAVVTNTTDGGACKYYAWVGGNGGATALADWVALGTVSDPSAETALTIEMSYWTSSVTATFKNDGTLLGNASYSVTSTAATSGKIASVACRGSGSVSALTGKSQYSVASYNNQKYATLADAVTAAGSTENAQITLNRDVAAGDSAEVPSTVKINANGKEIAGDITLNNTTVEAKPGESALDFSKVKIASKGKVQFNLKDSSAIASGSYKIAQNADSSAVGVNYSVDVRGGNANKEYTTTIDANGDMYAVVQTSADQITNMTFSSVALTNVNLTSFREFLNSNIGTVYNGADSSKANMAAALKEQGANGIAKWKSYALGLTPSVSTSKPAVQPVATDSDTSNVSLAVPNVSVAKGFAVTYKVQSTSNGTDWSDVAGTSTTDPSAIKVPTGSGRYKVVATVTPSK